MSITAPGAGEVGVALDAGAMVGEFVVGDTLPGECFVDDAVIEEGVEGAVDGDFVDGFVVYLLGDGFLAVGL